METIVRKMNENDMDAIEDILRRSGKWIVATMGVQFLVLTINQEKGERRQIVGCVGVAEGNRICYLAVDPKHRRRGYARKLLESAKRYIGGECYLRVRFTNFSAIRLYWSSKFVITGIFDRKSWVMTFKKALLSAAPEGDVVALHEAKTPAAFVRLSKKSYKLNLTHTYPTFVQCRYIHDYLPLDTQISGTVAPKVDLKAVNSVIREDYSWSISGQVKDAIRQLKGDEWEEYTGERGAWMKRFESFMYKEYNYKIASSELSTLGNILSTYRPSEYAFELTQKPDWKAGAFADANACWMNADQYKHKRDFFATGRGYAMKLYADKTFTRGIGRCWIFSNGELLFPFNNRGPEMHRFALVLSDALGFKTKYIHIDVEGRNEFHSYYVDNSYTYAMGKSIPENMDRYIMKWRKE